MNTAEKQVELYPTKQLGNVMNERHVTLAYFSYCNSTTSQKRFKKQRRKSQ